MLKEKRGKERRMEMERREEKDYAFRKLFQGLLFFRFSSGDILYSPIYFYIHPLFATRATTEFEV